MGKHEKTELTNICAQTMIIKVTKAEQLPICLDIIHKSFQTVAEDLHLTRENCPGHTAFMPPEKLRAAFDGGCSLFLCRYQNTFAGCFSLHPTADGTTLDHLAVLPPYRHLGLGKELVAYAADYAKDHLGAQKIQIGIVEENTVLKAWYQSQGFIHTGTKTFDHLPFTVGFMELKF